MRLSHVADLRHVKEFPCQICWPFLAHFRSSLREGSRRAELKAVYKGSASLRPRCEEVVAP